MSRRVSGEDVAIGGGILLVVLINLAWLGLLAWGIIELVQWVTSK